MPEAGTSACNLVPIRVDVLSDDKSIRIVDTLLFDPSCWPLPLYEPLSASVEENITHLAHTILCDAEVQGMAKTIRHFTGRIDLWSQRLQTAIEDQLRPQLWKIVEIVMDDEDMDIVATKLDVTTRIPISIRLMVDKIHIHETVLWDKHGPTSPLEFAQDMADELNLPEEAAIAIATTILEQLHGLPIDSSTTITASSNENEDAANHKSHKRGAWTMADPKEHASAMAQVIAQHRSI